MLDIEFKYYRANQGSLQEKYLDKFIVIKGRKVVGIYNSHSDAYYETIKNEELGTFLIQKIFKSAYNRPKKNRFSLFRLINLQRLKA